MPPVTPAPTSPLSDVEYTVLARARGKCALCKRAGADAATLIVPASYGGPSTIENLWPVHTRCGELRHSILGTSPTPPHAEGLTRLRALLPDLCAGVLHQAATSHERKPTYGSVDAITLLQRRIDANVGYALAHQTRPDTVSEEDWAWLQTSVARSALWEACWALLKSDA